MRTTWNTGFFGIGIYCHGIITIIEGIQCQHVRPGSGSELMVRACDVMWGRLCKGQRLRREQWKYEPLRCHLRSLWSFHTNANL